MVVGGRVGWLCVEGEGEGTTWSTAVQVCGTLWRLGGGGGVGSEEGEGERVLTLQSLETTASVSLFPIV